MNSKQHIFQNTDSFHALLIESLHDPEKATAYLQVALEEYQEDGDTEIFLLALRNVVEAHGGVGHLAKQTKLNRQNLYQVLSKKGNPRLNTLGILLKSLGLQLSIEPVHAIYFYLLTTGYDYGILVGESFQARRSFNKSLYIFSPLAFLQGNFSQYLVFFQGKKIGHSMLCPEIN
ncbi:MAG: DNA-binding protein [Gammaproteobacteria bacterium]